MVEDKFDGIPIAFNGEGVCGILGDRKTMTRRVMDPQPHEGALSMFWNRNAWFKGDEIDCCPYGKPGDLLWVQEDYSLNHSMHYSHDNGRGTCGMIYQASWGGDVDHYDRPFDGDRRWIPAKEMTKNMSRI